MLRTVMTAAVVVTAMGWTTATAGEATPQLALCGNTCAEAAIARPAIRNEMDDGVARIAVRAAVPSSSVGSLSNRELLSLYVLLALQGRAPARMH